MNQFVPQFHASLRHARGAARGYSLIEMMVTVSIVAILASIAFPSYFGQVQKTRRAEAQAALVELSVFMERFYTENHRYDQDRAGAAVSLPFTQAPKDDDQKYYDLSLQELAAQTYSLHAAPIGAQSADTECGTLTLDQSGARTASGPRCWQ